MATATKKKPGKKKTASKSPSFKVSKTGTTKKDIEALFPDGEYKDQENARILAAKLFAAKKRPVLYPDLVEACGGSLGRRTLGRVLVVLEKAGHFFEKETVETDLNKTGKTSSYLYLPNGSKSNSIARHDGPDATGTHPPRSQEAIEKQKATRAANKKAKTKTKRKRVKK